MGQRMHMFSILNLAKTWYVLHLDSNNQRDLFTIIFQHTSGALQPIRDGDLLRDRGVSTEIDNKNDSVCSGE